MDPSNTKEDILWNTNYKYDDTMARRYLRRAACYVKIYLPIERVSDLSYDRDIWLWPDEPLVLADWENHQFGVMEGTEDLHFKGEVMAVAESAFNASIDKVTWNREVISESKENKIKENMRKVFMMVLDAKYFKFDADNPAFSKEPIAQVEKVGVFLLKCASANDTESFDKFLDDENFLDIVLTDTLRLCDSHHLMV